MEKLKSNTEWNAVWMQENALYVKIANKLGVGYPELMVLYALATEENLTQKKIVENFGMQKQTVNTVIRQLRKKEYVALLPSQNDKREKILTLTKSGGEYCSSIVSPLLQAENKVYRIVGKEKMDQAKETMELINLLLEKEANKITRL